MLGNALSGLQWRDGRGGKGHSLSPVWSFPLHEQRKHFFLNFIFGLGTKIDSPPPYLGDSSDDWQRGYTYTSWEGLPPPKLRDARPAKYRCQTRRGPVLDTLTFELFPFSHLEVSEMDEDLSEALFWVGERSSEHLRFDILTTDGTLCLLKTSNPRRRKKQVESINIQTP